MQTTTGPSVAIARPTVTWERLPDDYGLPDEPVDNLSQPLLAAALREILELAGLIGPDMLIATNFGICATVEGKTVVKAPDWVYVSEVLPLPANQTRRSYTPHLEGKLPELVIEFISETEGGEYSMNPHYPYGKWWFYERILKVPSYFIFQPEAGNLESYQLVAAEHYEPQDANPDGRYWLESLGLFIGVWQGTKADRTGYWLRWWNSAGNLLPWGTESVEQERQRTEQERQRAEQERQRAEQERQRAEQLAERLKALGVDPDDGSMSI
jgi:Uma2 family endonuclease